MRRRLDRLDALRGVDYAIALLSEGEGALLEIGFLLGPIGRARMCFAVAGNPVLGRAIRPRLLMSRCPILPGCSHS